MYRATNVEWVGNQLPILLIDFRDDVTMGGFRWESVTNPLDRLPWNGIDENGKLGISYQSS